MTARPAHARGLARAVMLLGLAAALPHADAALAAPAVLDDVTGGGSGLARRGRAPKQQAEITYAGFVSRPDGGATVFVEITQEVPVEKAQSGRSVIYTLKNAKVVVRNNLHPLLTREFASVVTSARLVPDKKAKATKLVIELREVVEPTHRMVAGQDGAMLEVSFPAPKPER